VFTLVDFASARPIFFSKEKVIFLLGSALNRAVRRGYAHSSLAKIFPLKLPQFLPARRKLKGLDKKVS